MPFPANNKLKVFNDPVYGFINVPDESIFDILETPFFQRLRRIKQLGLSHLVYPGALHTRFHHAMGAMYLMGQAIEILRFKGHDITQSDALAVTHAILLHDIGHGPFSHTLEKSLVPDLGHEELTKLFMKRINQHMGNGLDDAIQIFEDTYPVAHLHQLVSGQLDMDRLDYLNRDSFFTGVSEGVISWDRIIKMLNISNGQLVIDEKGIYSIEKFLIARRLMYWQVYLHKTVIAAERMLTNLIRRAKELSMAGEVVPASAPLCRFLSRNYSKKDFQDDPGLLEDYALLDDHDIYAAMKSWTTHKDYILRYLSASILNRQLFKISIQKTPFDADHLAHMKKLAVKFHPVNHPDEINYFVSEGKTRNNAYDPGAGSIYILSRDGNLTDIAEASDQLNINVLSHPVEKSYLCFPKDLQS